MTDEQQTDQQKESDQLRQRRANFEELQRLGVDRRTRTRSTRTDTDRGAGRGARREDRRGARGREGPDRRPPGGSWRSAASARPTSWSSRTARAQIQAYIRQDSLTERDFAIFKLLDFGDFVGVEGHLFRTKTNELTIWASTLRVPRQVLHPAAREVARPAGRRDPLPPALPRSDRQSRTRAGCSRSAAACSTAIRGVPQRARLPRGRDADDAADRRRRAGAAVRDASQRARHAALPAHRAGAVPEAPGRRRASSGSTRSTATSGTRGSRRSTIPSSRCSSSTRPTAITSELMDMTEEMLSAVRAGGDRHATRSRSASTRSRWRRRTAACRCAKGAREAASSGWATPVSDADLRDRETRRGARAPARHRGRSRRGAPARSRPRSSSG